jgi:hypothetical protein
MIITATETGEPAIVAFTNIKFCIQIHKLELNQEWPMLSVIKRTKCDVAARLYVIKG